jgi:hypothetical protein
MAISTGMSVTSIPERSSPGSERKKLLQITNTPSYSCSCNADSSPTVLAQLEAAVALPKLT